MQVSRGAEFGRNHLWPEGLKPTLFAYLTELDALPLTLADDGVTAVTAQEIRWARRDIKSTSLLGNILLKKLAADAGAFETIMLENGELTEGSSTTVHVVKNSVIHTPPNSHHILPGTTRDVVTELADLLSIRNVSAPISESALRGADEIWLAFSTRGVLPVTKLDGAAVGGGKPGPLFKRMSIAYTNYIRELGKTPAL
jgi:D-alanine transaminase